MKYTKKFKNNNKKIYYIYCKFLFIILLIIILLFLEQKNNLIKLNSQIICENTYDGFEIMKQRFSNDSFVKPHLEEITIVNHFFHKNYTYLKKNKNDINICVSLNNIYVYKSLVSMESVLSNCNKEKTFIIYHVLCAPDFKKNSVKILESLMNRYSLNLEMIFYNMGKSFYYLKHRRLTQTTFYRLLLPLFVNLERILYLDGDTLTFKDISEIFKLDFNNTYILGTLDYKSDGVDQLGIMSKTYINAGTILINLEKIRSDKKYIDLINITWQKVLENDDQTAFNYALYPKIGTFPVKYNVFTFYDKSDINYYLKSLRKKVNVTYIEEALYDPMIIHSVGGPKFWNLHSKKFDLSQKKDKRFNNYHSIWLYYANKTDYYKEIIDDIKFNH